MIPTVKTSRRRYIALGLILILILMGWTARHIIQIVQISNGQPQNQFSILWVLVFGSLMWHLGLAWMEKPYKTNKRQQKKLDKLVVTLNVPIYNEDPRVVRLVLNSLIGQTRKPNRIQVVDDGSEEDYKNIRKWWYRKAKAAGIKASWVRTENSGKRHAQLTTFLKDDDADIFITIDSDTVIESNGVEEGLKPFARKDVTSVAAIILAQNSSASWFTRLTDPWLLTFQLGVRSALSKLGSVLVNSGNYSLYRAKIIREGADVYANEHFFGHPVQFSDDSLLTTFAYLKGRTVQQPTAIGFTVLPENVNHHLRQQLRWMRGSFIRYWWRFRYLPIRSFAYWEHFASWLNFSLIFFAFGYIWVYAPLINHKVIPGLLLFSVLTSYAISLKYLTIQRSDQSFRWQVLTYLMSPIMMLWTALFLRPLRIYSMITCYKTGWGTRKKVEVKLA